MSRSIKKFPIIKQEKVNKKIWNKRMRRKSLDFNMRGSQYKKCMVNWDNWQYPWFIERAIRNYKTDRFLQKQFSSLEDYLNYYKKCCIRK